MHFYHTFKKLARLPKFHETGMRNHVGNLRPESQCNPSGRSTLQIQHYNNAISRPTSKFGHANIDCQNWFAELCSEKSSVDSYPIAPGEIPLDVGRHRAQILKNSKIVKNRKSLRIKSIHCMRSKYKKPLTTSNKPRCGQSRPNTIT